MFAHGTAYAIMFVHIVSFLSYDVLVLLPLYTIVYLKVSPVHIQSPRPGLPSCGLSSMFRKVSPFYIQSPLAKRILGLHLVALA